MEIRGGIKKKYWFFSEKLRKGGGGVSPNPKFSYQKKLRFFWNFFLKGGGSHLFQKGVIIKNGDIGIFLAKKGALTQSIEMLSKKNWEYFGIFRQKGGGSRQFRNFLIRKNWGFRIAERGGVSEFRSFSEEKKNSFFYASPYCQWKKYLKFWDCQNTFCLLMHWSKSPWKSEYKDDILHIIHT